MDLEELIELQKASGGIAGLPKMDMHPADSVALATMTTPILGDAAGLFADARRYIQEPESRTPGNFALTGIGLLPFVPGMTVFHGTGARMTTGSTSM